MTMYVEPIGGAAREHEVDVVSPELALVDPELGRAARELLVHPAESAARARLLAVAPKPEGASLEWSVEPVVRAGERSSRRLLFGVAVVTMLALLLFDVRVEVGQRPAAAEPGVAREPLATDATPPPAAHVTTKKPQAVGPVRPSRERRFAWAPYPGASGYHVEFFAGSERVFGGDTNGPSLTVPPRWSFGGQKRSFRAGEYGWYVWPIVDGRRQSRAVVQTTLRIARS